MADRDDAPQPGEREDGTAPRDGEDGEAPRPADGGSGSEGEGEGGGATDLGFPVVAVGASAGGLEAFSELLSKLPVRPGMAIVFVQHLDPRHESALTEILPRSTKMAVCEATDGMRIEKDRIHIIPPDRDLAVMSGALQLMQRPEAPARHMPVDFFMRSLADDQGANVIGVILSGTGSDGAEGVRAVKAAGGITLAQSEESARYSGMPAAAVATGRVDIVLSIPELAQELVRIVRHPGLGPLPRPPAGRTADAGDAGGADPLQKVFFLLRRATGVDFSQYKRSTVERRIGRRLVLHRLETIDRYVRYLQQTPAEVHALFDDMLINVTGFFREPAAFDVLAERVFPQLVRDRDADTPIRIWVPACSTGEEAYSLAIALLEYMGAEGHAFPVQIFASDVSEASIERARAGRYPPNISGDLSPERLRRFFVKAGAGFQISKSLRDLCVFAQHNVIKDPPFSNLDLISCRNLLIYMGAPLQKRVIPTFHYALKPTGHLLLGRSETIGAFSDLFALVDRDSKVYAKKASVTRLPPSVRTPEPVPPTQPSRHEFAPPAGFGDGRDLEREADRVVLESWAPPGVIVNAEMEILQFRGRTGRYLEPSPGSASLHLLRMARPGLALDLRAMVHECRKSGQAVRKEGLTVAGDDGVLTVDVEVHPLGEPHSEDLHFVVLFDDAERTPRDQAGPQEAGTAVFEGDAVPRAEYDRLDSELEQTRATLQSIIEEHESTNEELRAANEEIQSANEELQSTNEELETAKEELQSTNEELITLNAELENQNNEANRAIDDFTNLHRSVDIPVILLDNDLRIRTFTPPAARQLKLRPADEGRRIGELKLGIRFDGIEDRIHEVLSSLNTCVEEVPGDDGRWYSLRVRPYRTTDDRITGAVVVLVDVTESHAARQAIHDVDEVLQRVLHLVPEPLAVLDRDQRLRHVSRGFCEVFGVSREEARNVPLPTFADGALDAPPLREALAEVLRADARPEARDIEHDVPGLGRRHLRVRAYRVDQIDDHSLLLLTIEEDT